MIVWREKLIAFAIHFAVTLAVGLLAGALIFFVWFPGALNEMLGGSKLFLLVVGCDLALGPLISLVIYNSRKSRRELILDYSIVGLVQFAALVYGMSISFNARPVYIVFVKDRLEVIRANEIEDEDLKAATLPEFRTLPLWGPKLVAARVKPEDRNDALAQGASGKDVSRRPKFFVSYDSQLDEIRGKLQTLDELKQKHPTAEPLIRDRVGPDAKADASLKWLVVQHKQGFWTALVNAYNARPIDFLPIDPF